MFGVRGRLSSFPRGLAGVGLPRMLAGPLGSQRLPYRMRGDKVSDQHALGQGTVTRGVSGGGKSEGLHWVETKASADPHSFPESLELNPSDSFSRI